MTIMWGKERKKGETESRKLREKEVYDLLKGRGDKDYYAWDRNLMAELYSDRRAFHKRVLADYIRGKRILILGCGRGAGVKTLEPYAKEIIGIDISERMIALARKAYPNLHFIICDAESLPLRDRSFEVVYCKAILHHLDIEKALKEILRVLTPQGYLYVADECGLLNPIAWIRRRFFPSNIHTPDEHPFIPYSFRKILHRHGFREIAFESKFLLSPVVPVLGQIMPHVNWRPLLHFLLGVDKLLILSLFKQLCWRIAGLYQSLVA